MKKINILGAVLFSMASCQTIQKGLTTDCKPHCDRITVTSGKTGKQYQACYCDSSNQYRKLIGKLEEVAQ